MTDHLKPHETFMQERKEFFEKLEKKLGGVVNHHQNTPATDEQKSKAQTVPLPVKAAEPTPTPKAPEQPKENFVEKLGTSIGDSLENR